MLKIRRYKCTRFCRTCQRPPDATGKLIAEFLEDINMLITYAEEPHLSRDLSFSFGSYEDLIRQLKKKWEGRKK